MGKFDGRTETKIGSVGRLSERQVAAKLGARVTPASGAMEGAKGDMSLDDYLLEAKSSVNKSFSLKHEWLEKITQEALPLGKTPALTVSFTDGSGRPIRNGDWVLIPLTEFKEMLDA